MDATHDVGLSAGTIGYRVSGSGTPIVFVHGLLVNGLLWRKVAPQLEGVGRVIVPDWPLGSHARPMRPDTDTSPRDDTFFPLDTGRRLATLFPHARFEEVRGSRTFVPEDQPERLGALIKAFVHEPVAA
jgi:pimeloyl-ACP methyl ester carboxylesterase